MVEKFSVFVPSLLFLGVAIVSETNAWENYRRFRVVTFNKSDGGSWRDVVAELRSASWPDLDLDVWRETRTTVDVMIPPHATTRLIGRNRSHKLKFSIAVEDVGRLISPATSTAHGGEMSWTKFHTFPAISDWLRVIALKHNQFANVIEIGKTFEGRQQTVIRINSHPKRVKPIIFIDGGIHAREWISPATVTYMINEMLQNYTAHKTLVDSFEWFFLPVFNADGYEYTYKEDRLWRKTRSTFALKMTGCRGADPNRNFPIHWAQGFEANLTSCSESFPGVRASSEPSVKNVMSFLESISHGGHMAAYFSLHAYGQYWLVPYAYADRKPVNFKDQMEVAEAGAEGIRRIRGSTYNVGTPPDLLYAASGSSMDWVHDVLKVPFAFGLELPPSSNLTSHRTGFLISESEIVPVGMETLAGISAAAMAIKSKIRGRSRPAVFEDRHGGNSAVRVGQNKPLGNPGFGAVTSVSHNSHGNSQSEEDSSDTIEIVIV